MNKIHRSIWNEVTRTFVAVAEIARSKGKKASSSTDAVGLNVQPLALEQRFMFDGAALSTLDPTLSVTDATHIDIDKASGANTEALAKLLATEPVPVALVEKVVAPTLVRGGDLAQNHGRKEVAFVDTSVQDYQVLIDGIGAGIEVQLIDGSQDGLTQMAVWAQMHSEYDAIHILSHGSLGSLHLGTTSLIKENLNEYADQLAIIGGSLTASGDILIYGCSIVNTTIESEFVEKLAQMTGANIAASDDPTGTSRLGGNWGLEYGVDIEANSIFVDNYQQILGGATTFTRIADPFPDVDYDIRISFGDFDCDGDVDALSQQSNVIGQGFIFTRANADGTYTNINQVGSSIPNSPFANVSLNNLNGVGGFYVAGTVVLDYDSDGDVDIISRSGSVTGGANFLLRNDNGNFVRIADPFPDVDYDVRIEFADFDSDGDIDALSQQSNVVGAGYIYSKRNSDGTYTNFNQVGTSIPNTPFASVDLSGMSGLSFFAVDYDNDGDRDIINRSDSASGQNYILRNDSGTYIKVSDVFVNTTYDLRMTFGDFDNDGDIDALQQSSNVMGQGYMYVQRNSDGTYTRFDQVGTSIPNTPFSTVDLTGLNGTTFYTVDIDSDGDLDVISRSGSATGGANFVLKSDDSPPTLKSITPSDNALNVALDANIDITFSEAVTAGAGNIYIKKVSDKSVVETIAANSQNVTVVGSNVTINPTLSFSFSTEYYLAFDLDAFLDSDQKGFGFLDEFVRVPYDAPALFNYKTLDPDATPPVFDAIPSVGSVASDGFVPFASINEAGKVYYVVVPNNSAAPSVSDVKTGKASGGALALASGSYDSVSGGFDTGFSAVTGLVAGTDYDVYFVAKDVSDNDQTSVTKIDVTTVLSPGPVVTTPAPILLIDSAASDVFLNTTGNIVATGNVSGYGIYGGTSGGSSSIGGVAYDVSKLGAYGTLYVKSSDGSYAYVPNAAVVNALSANQTETFTVQATDSNGTGSATLTINVTGVNDAPINTAPTAVTVVEDIAGALIGISFSDVDAGSANVTATFSVATGTLSATSGSGVTVGGTATARTLTGSLSSINAFIAASGLTYTTASNDTSSVTLTVSLNDAGNTGSGGAQTDTDSVTIQVTPVNDVPAVIGLNGNVALLSTPGGEYIDEQPNGNSDVAEILDPDIGSLVAGEFAGGSITISRTSGPADGNFVSDLNDQCVAFGPDLLNLSGTPQAGDKVFVDAGQGGASYVDIGTLDATKNGQSGADLEISLNAATTPALLSRFINFLKFDATAEGSQVFSLVVKDSSSVASAPVSFTVTVPDTTPPTLVAANCSPADNATGIAPSANIELTFSENIVAGTGSVILYNVSTGAVVETFNIATGGGNGSPPGAVSVVGNKLTINPGSNLAEATQYAVRIDATAIKDSANNAYAGISNDTTYNFNTGVTDTSAPTLLAIQRNNPSIENTTSASVEFVLRFNEPVTHVDATDFTVNASSGLTGASISNVTGSGTQTIVVTVSGYSGTGTLGLNIKAGQNITDIAGVAFVTAEPADDELYKVDRTAPTLLSFTRLNPSNQATNGSSAEFLAVFSENVTGVDADDFDLTGTLGTAIGDAGNIAVSGSGATRTVTVSNLTGAGTLGLDLNSGATIVDTANNSLINTTPTTTVDEIYVRDITAPTAVAITRATGAAVVTNANSVTFNVVFSEGVQDVGTDDFTLNTTGTATGNIASVTGSGGAYTVTVTGVAGSGELGLNFNGSPTSVIRDAAGNTLSLSNPEPSTDETYAIDNTAPTVVAIKRGQVNQVAAGASSVVFNVEFSEPVTGVAVADFAVRGTANASVASVSASSGKAFQVMVNLTNPTLAQTVGLDYTGSVTDGLSQTGTAAYTSGEIYTIGGVLLNEGAIDQAALDALMGVNRDGTQKLVTASGVATEVVIVDSRVPGLAEQLTSSIRPGTDVWLLDGKTSATAQISAILAQYTQLSAVHLISHGSAGAVYLGSETISSATLTAQATALAAWGSALSDSGDFLLYGCDVAKGSDGQAFVNAFAQATGADVAASDDLTGASWLGGDWVLEVHTGNIDVDLFEDKFNSEIVLTASKVTIWTPQLDFPIDVNDGWSVYYTDQVAPFFYGLKYFYEDKAGATVDTIASGHLTSNSLDGSNLLFVMLPTENFTANDLIYMSSFLNTGGRIVFYGENNGWIPSINSRLTNAISSLGGSFSVLSTDLSSTQTGDLTGSYISLTSPLASGLTKLYYNAASEIAYSGAVDIVVSGPNSSGNGTSGLVVDQAVGNGRIMLITDVNIMETFLSSYSQAAITPYSGSVGPYLFSSLTGLYTNNPHWGDGTSDDPKKYIDPSNAWGTSNQSSYWTANYPGADTEDLFLNLLSNSRVNQQVVGGGGNPNSGFGGSPVVVITANDVSISDDGSSSYSFDVRYQGASASYINTSTVDIGDVTIKNVTGTSLTVTSATVISGSGTNDVMVRYTVTPIGGTWDSTDNGVYTIGLVNAAVADLAGKQTAGNLSAKTFSVAITNNVAPSISNIPDQSIPEDGVSTGISVVLGDVETAVADLTLLATSSNTVLLLNANIVVSGIGANRTVTITPESNKTGTAIVTLVVTDAEGGTVAKSFNLTVTDVNPVISNATVGVDENSTSSLVVTTVAATGDNTGVIYSITGGTGQTLFDINANTGAITVKSGALLDHEAVSSYTLTVAVDDEDVDVTADSTATITVNINDVNETPTDISLATVSFNNTQTTAGATLTTISGTDPDGSAPNNTLSYSLVNSGGNDSADNASFTVSGTSLQVASGSALGTGTYHIRLKVMDGGSLPYEKAFTITVTDPLPTLQSASPADNATGVAITNNIVLTFSENISAGTGSIVLYDITGNGADNRTIAITDNSQISINGTTLTINPSSNLLTTNQYALHIGATALKDSGNQNYGGISDNTTLNFTTGTVDTTAPLASIVDIADPTQPHAGVASIHFTEQVQNVDIGDFSLTRDTGSGAQSVSLTGLSVGGSGSTYTLDLSAVTTVAGTYVLTFNPANITDTSGNALAAGASDTFVIDKTAPTAAALVRASAENPTDDNSVDFTVVFSEDVDASTVTANDFTLTGTATTGASIGSITAVSGNVYTVTVNNVAGDGTLGLDLNSSATGITDVAGNAINGGVTGQQYTIDNTAPTVVAINRNAAEAVRTSPVTFTVSFDEDVTGVDASDFTVVGTGTATGAGSVSSVIGSGSTYTVTVNIIFDSSHHDGTLGIELNATGTGIVDVAGNAIATGFTQGGNYLLDRDIPAWSSPSNLIYDLPENMASGFVIGQVSATDIGGSGVSSYRIHSGDNNHYFAVDSQGVITLTAAGATAGAASFDYEINPNSFTLEMVASDGTGNDSIPLYVTVNILDEQENQRPILDLNGSVSGTGHTVALSGIVMLADTAAVVDDLDIPNKATWDQGSLTVNRVTAAGIADATAHDIFSFTNSSNFSVDNNTLKNNNSNPFATFTQTGGVLQITFNSTATTTLIQDVARHIGYSNDTPYGDTTIRMILNDGSGQSNATATADVVVTSAIICVDQTNDTDTEGDAADGFSLREALARGVAQSGADTITVKLADNSTITLSNAVTLGTGDTLDVDNANGLTVTGSTINLNANTRISNGAGDTVTVSSAIAGSGMDLTKTGSGTLILSGSNTYSGITTVDAGTLVTNGLGNSSGLTLDSGTLKARTSNGLSFAQGVTLGNGGGTVDLSNGSVTLGGVVSGTGVLTVNTTGGGSALSLQGQNTYSAGTALNSGILELGSNSALGTGTLTVAGGKVRAGGGAARSLSNNVVLAGNLTMSGSNALTFSGSVDLGGSQTAYSINNTIAADLTLSGVVGNGHLNINSQGSGAVVLSGTNTYTNTTINKGALSVAGDANLGTGQVTLSAAASTTASLVVTTDSSIDNNWQVAGAGSNVVDTQTHAVILTGAFTGTGNLTKSGSGVLTLSNTGNESGMTGGVVVTAGTLAVANDDALQGGTLTLAAGTVLQVTGATTLDNAVTLTGAAALQTDAAVTLSGALSGGAYALTKTGIAALTLSNTGNEAGLTGGITVAGGTLAVTEDDALVAGTVTLAAGTALQITGATTLDNAVTLTGAATLQTDAAVTLSGALSGGAYALTKTGTAALTLSNTGNEAGLTGGVTVAGGTLAVTEDDALVAGTVTLAAGTTLEVTGSSTVDNDLALTGSATLKADADLTWSGVISGVGQALTKTGSGTLTLSGTNTYSGTTTVNAGTLVTDSFGNSSGLTLDSGTLKARTSNGLSLAQGVTLGNGGGTVDLSNGSVTLGGVVSGTGVLTVNTTGGGSALSLEGQNTYSAGTALNSGILELGSNSALGTGTLSIAGGKVRAGGGAARSLSNNVVLAGNLTMSGSNALTFSGSVDLGGSQTAYSINNTIAADLTLSGVVGNGHLNINSQGSGAVVLSGTNTYTNTTINKGVLRVAGDANLGTGQVTLSAAASSTASLVVTTDSSIDNNWQVAGAGSNVVDTQTHAITLVGALTGTGTLTKVGTGMLTLANTLNETGMTGNLSIANGTLALASDEALTGGTLTLAAVTTLQVTSTTTIDNQIVLTGQSTIDNAQAVIFSGSVTGAGGFSKQGQGELTLSGIEVYAGATTVVNGTLVVNGAVTGQGPLNVLVGAKLAGTGTISGVVNVASGGILAPGHSPGLFRLNGGVNVASGAYLNVEIDGLQAGSLYDQIAVGGLVDVTGADLSLTVDAAYQPQLADSFVLIDNDANDSVVGNFNGLSEGGVLTLNQRAFRISYVGGDGNDVVLTTINTAPVLDTGPDVILPSVIEDVLDANNTGFDVASVVAQHAISDVDIAPVTAIAITEIDNTHGHWQYSIDNGQSWQDLSAGRGSVVDLSATARLLDGTLIGSNTQQVRFVPDVNFNGSAGFSFRAWDQSSEVSGSTADTTLNGGYTPFSAAVKSVTMQITAVNDTPALVVPAPIAYTDAVGVDDFQNVTGTAVAPDAESDTVTYGVQGGAVGSYTIGSVGYDVSKVGSYGTLYLDSTSGAYVYVPNDVAINGLSNNASESFTLTAGDGNSSANQNLAISLTGSNDTPVLQALSSIAYTDVAGVDDFQNVTGNAVAPDVEGNTVTYGVQGGAVGSYTVGGVGYDVSKVGSYGTLYLDSTNGAYVYVPNDVAINGLSNPASESFTLTAGDGNSSANQNLSINLTGSNDTPVLQALSPILYTDGMGPDTFSSVTGHAVASDAEGTSVTYGLQGGTGGHYTVDSVVYDVTQMGSYGILYLNSGTGSYVYVPNPDAINALPSDSSESFVITATDGGLTGLQTVTVQLSAANDLPILSGLPNQPAVYQENGAPLALAPQVQLTDADNGQLSGAVVQITDVQVGDVLAVSNLPTGITASYDSIQGKLTFTGVASVADYQAALRSVTFHSSSEDPTWHNTDLTRSVSWSMSDALGAKSLDSSSQINLIATDDLPQGSLLVSGLLMVGSRVQVDDQLSDVDGLGVRTYQWQVQKSDGTWQNILGATGSSYEPDPTYTGQKLRVVGTYIDQNGFANHFEGAATAEGVIGLPPPPASPAPVSVAPTATVPTPVLTPIQAVLESKPEFIPPTVAVQVGASGGLDTLGAGSSTGLTTPSTAPAVVVVPTTPPPTVAPTNSTPAVSVAVPSVSLPAASLAYVSVGSDLGSGGLRAVGSISDVVAKAGEAMKVTLPVGTFVHSNRSANITVVAKLADGRPLPSYVKFDPSTGSLTVNAALGQTENLQVVLTARDETGQEASRTFSVKVGAEKEAAPEKATPETAQPEKNSLLKPRAAGKLALSEQIRNTHKPSGLLSRLAALSQAYAATQTHRMG